MQMNLFVPERQSSVGHSDNRSPIKHRMYHRQAGMEVGSAPHVARKHRVPYPGHLIVDMTAGDAVGDGKNPWWRASSPAIVCKLASQQRSLRVHLYEKDKAAFQVLIANLGERLPEIGFVARGETSWIHGVTRSTVDAFYGDARKLEKFELRPYEWLFVNNDPNNMHGMVLDLSRLAEIMSEPQGSNGAPRFGAFMTTMGCNAGGLKRLARIHREWWFTHIEQAISLLDTHDRLDLVLFEIVGDADQWAYLLLVPKKWAEDKIVPWHKLFAAEELEANAFTWRCDRSEFTEAINRLFYTDKERRDGSVWHI